jgi:hypothetical protein
VARFGQPQAKIAFGEQKAYKKPLETKDLQRIKRFATLHGWSEMVRNGLKLVQSGGFEPE